LRGDDLEPRYLLYDEPTSGLDPASSAIVESMMKRLQAERSITSLVVTHDIDLTRSSRTASRSSKKDVSSPSPATRRRSARAHPCTSISSKSEKGSARKMPSKASRVVRVFIIIIVAVAASALLYLLVNNFQFRRGTSIRVHFASVGDLNSGAWVRKAGIKVGSVTRLEPAEDEKTVIVTLTFKPGLIVRSTDRFALVAKGILGDMYMEQKTGAKGFSLAQEGQLYEGQQPFSITDLLGGDTMNMVTDLAGGLKGLIDVLKKNESEIDSTLKDISLTARNLRIVTDRAVVITDSVPDITRQITGSISELQATVDDVSNTSRRLLARLEKNLDSSSEDLAATMKSVRASSATSSRRSPP